MKKIISLICCVAVMLSLCATSALAADSHITMTVEKTSVKVGDTFTVSLDQGALSASTFAGKIVFDKEYLKVTAVTDLRDKTNGYVMYDDDGDEMRGSLSAFTNPDAANSTGEAGYSLQNTQEKNYLLTSPIIKVTFEAIKAGSTSVSVYETSDGATAYTGTHSATAITIASAEPEEPEAPVVGETPVVDAENKAKTWTVDIDADYVAAGDTLTAILYDTTNTTDTQEVTLSMGNNVVVGGAAWSFTLKATFENAAKMADIGLRVSK